MRRSASVSSGPQRSRAGTFGHRFRSGVSCSGARIGAGGVTGVCSPGPVVGHAPLRSSSVHPFHRMTAVPILAQAAEGGRVSVHGPALLRRCPLAPLLVNMSTQRRYRPCVRVLPGLRRDAPVSPLMPSRASHPRCTAVRGGDGFGRSQAFPVYPYDLHILQLEAPHNTPRDVMCTTYSPWFFFELAEHPALPAHTCTPTPPIVFSGATRKIENVSPLREPWRGLGQKAQTLLPCPLPS